MAFIRTCIILPVALFCTLFTNAQTVSYPAQSSQLLKATAQDAAMLLQKAVSGSQFSVSSYTALPQTGIIFVYDSAITHNQMCRVQSDGISYIKFSASQDNGLCFGLYQYLQNLGYRFYLPGADWEIIPSLVSAYKKTDSIFSSQIKYNTWAISGGCNQWAMDKNSSFSWDTYAGENGHAWALYQRRNGMLGAYRFAGHQSGLMTGTNITQWQNNPCYVASYNNSRVVNAQSVPDVNSTAGRQLWASIIEQKYTTYKNTIMGNTNLYVNQYRNFNYGHFNMGIEVPDGAHWGNTNDNNGCGNAGYSKESDQSITLANSTAEIIGSHYPNLRFQLYAYAAHADVPSANIAINSKLDIQLIPEVYQNITSTNGLRNRWYNKTQNISEYNYLNLSGWSGETPAFSLKDFKATLQIAKIKKSQGLMWEASPAKFASLPYLLAANKNLQNDIAVDSALMEFCNNMYAGAGKTIYSLLQLWADENAVTGGVSNRYKLPLYFKMVNEAQQKIINDAPIFKTRLQQLKAYLHYMLLYYNWLAEENKGQLKTEKAAALCLYLAKINKLQLVNSYYMITTITAKYDAADDFYKQYNVTSGTVYQNGSLALITAAQIENDFTNDLANAGTGNMNYKFEAADAIAGNFKTAGLQASKKINVKLNYTNGLDYYGRSEFFIIAPAAGNFTINYTPTFAMAGKGYINFTVESTDEALGIVEDFSINRAAKAGTLIIRLPAAGGYKMTISSKYKSAAGLEIITNKNQFFKSGAYFGKTTELYDNNNNIPGFFYVPAGVNKIFFSISGSYTAGKGYVLAEKINSAFAIQDNNGNTLIARLVTPNDSALFYIDIPQHAIAKFCRITKKADYNLVFSNISNLLWYAEAITAPCSNSGFTISSIKKNGDCIVQLTALPGQAPFNWKVTDGGKTYTYTDKQVIELPDNISTDALVTLTNGLNCSFSKTIGQDENFIKQRQACKTMPAMQEAAIIPVVYPNPSTGNYKCIKNGSEFTADKIFISNALGNEVAVYNNSHQFNISNMPSGMYWYKIVSNGIIFSGKLVKL